jgi:hypothetical protein
VHQWLDRDPVGGVWFGRHQSCERRDPKVQKVERIIMEIFFYIQWAILIGLGVAVLAMIIQYMDLFVKMASGTLVLWVLTAVVGIFQSPTITWAGMKTFGIVYGFGMLIVFLVCAFIVRSMNNEKAYQEPYDDEAPSVTYIGEPVVVDGEIVDDVPTPLRGLWKLLPTPKWQNPYEKVGNMGYGGTIGGEWEFVNCKKCKKVTGQKQVSAHTYVCREPGCANVNCFEE